MRDKAEAVKLVDGVDITRELQQWGLANDADIRVAIEEARALRAARRQARTERE